MKRVFISVVLTFIIVFLANAQTPRTLRTVEHGFETNPTVVMPMGADADTMLGYTIEEDIGYYWPIPDDQGDKWQNVRFSPTMGRQHTFYLDEFRIILYTVIGEEGFGTPDMNVRVWQSVTDDIDTTIHLPGELIDEMDVANEDLVFNTDESNVLEMSTVNMRPLNISFGDSIDFHIGIDLIADDENDILAVYHDFADTLDHSSVWDGLENAWARTVQIPFSYNGRTLRHKFNFAMYVVISDHNGVEWEIGPDGAMQPSIILLSPAYPNPFNGDVSVRFSVRPGENYAVNLRDNLGRQIRQLSSGVGNGESRLSVNSAGLSAGVYYLNILTSDAQVTQRLVYLR